MFAHNIKIKIKMFADHDKIDQFNSHFSYVKHTNSLRVDFKNADLSGSINYDPIHDRFLIMGMSPYNQTIQYWAAQSGLSKWIG